MSQSVIDHLELVEGVGDSSPSYKVHRKAPYSASGLGQGGNMSTEQQQGGNDDEYEDEYEVIQADCKYSQSQVSTILLLIISILGISGLWLAVHFGGIQINAF